MESHLYGLKTCLFHIHANQDESLAISFQLLPTLHHHPIHHSLIIYVDQNV